MSRREKLVEASGTVWDAEKMAEISAGVGQLLFDAYPNSNDIERDVRMADFRSGILDLSRGLDRTSSLPIVGNFIHLDFFERPDPYNEYFYNDETGYLYFYNDRGRLAYLNFYKSKPTLKIKLNPRYPQMELLQAGVQFLQDSLHAVAAMALDRYADLVTDREEQELTDSIPRLFRRGHEIMGRFLLRSRPIYSFRFSDSLMTPGIIQVPAESINTN